MDMNESIRKARTLIEALPYIQQFRDSKVAIKLGGSAMDDPECTESVLRDIVFMECAGMKPLIIHGGGKAISKRLEEKGIESTFVNGLRYTDEQTIQTVDSVLHNEVNADLVNRMRRLDGKPYPLSGKDVLRGTRFFSEDPVTGEKQDLGYVGRVIDVDTEQLRWVLNRREVPVITPLASDMDGTVYNVNADMVACRIAADLKVEKLVFLSDVPGLLQRKDDESSLISTIGTQDVDELTQKDIIAGGMVPKCRSAAEAVEEGTGKVHMIDARMTHALLLEIFTDKGIGTEIVAGKKHLDKGPSDRHTTC